MKQTIFITGASTGLGKETAKLFAANGWNVIATMRKPENENELAQLENITLLPLDVTDAAQITDTVEKAIALYDIDVVFNNAGYGLMGPLEAIDDAQLVRQIDTNLLGVIRVTKAFLPHFREKRKGLFISTTSIGGLITFPLSSIYHATKWAIEGWSESMWFELKSMGIGIKTVSPGGIKTDFLNRSMEVAKHPAYEHLLVKLFSSIHEDQFSEVSDIAATVFEAATDGKQKLRYLAGEDAKALYEQRRQSGDEQFMRMMDQTFFGVEN